VFARGGAVLVSPCPDAVKEVRSVLQLLEKGKFEKARRSLASLEQDRRAHPEIPLLAALTDFLAGDDPKGARLEPLLDAARPEQAQNLAELAFLNGDYRRAVFLYGGLPAVLIAAGRLEKRLARVREAYLDETESRAARAAAYGETKALEDLLKEVPPDLEKDPRVVHYAFIAACAEGQGDRARALLPGLSPSDRDRYKELAALLDLDPSQRLSLFQKAGKERLMDPAWQLVYSRTLDVWLIANMPPDYAAAYASPALTQRELALLLCLYFPGLKGAAPPPSDLPAALLEDREADCLAALRALGFFPEWSAGMTVSGSALVNALARAMEGAGRSAPCPGTWEDYRKCGLIPPEWDAGNLSGGQVGWLVHRLKGETQ
jgi:hypothetical protein